MNAAIYCRVSTDEEIQVNALQVQINEAREHTKALGWKLVDEYIDEGKTGTTRKKRDEYNRLVDDMETNKFDVIVIKTQDRLMRNTKDWYIFIDKLVQNKKKLFFYLENKFYTPDDALLTGIKAILAEEYSRDLSKKLNNAHKGRQRQGKRVVLTSRTWGYDVINRKVYVNEKEADMIRLIFDLCIQGYGSRSISKTLSDMGYKSHTGRDIPEVTIRKIIQNPLYYGTAIMNKKHFDFDTKQTIRNDKSEWIYAKDAVPAIIDEDTFRRANAVVQSHSKAVKSDEFTEKHIGIKCKQFKLSGKIICGECGSTYWRRYNCKNKSNTVSWSCSEYLKRGRKTTSKKKVSLKKVVVDGRGCDSPHIKEGDLNNLLCEVANSIFKNDNSKVIKNSINVMEMVLNSRNTQLKKKEIVDKIEANQTKRSRLTDSFLDGVIDKIVYVSKDAELKEEYEKLNEQMYQIESDESKKKDKMRRLEDIKENVVNFINKELTLDLICDCIDKIIVYHDTLEIHFYVLDTIYVKIERVNYRKINYVIL